MDRRTRNHIQGLIDHVAAPGLDDIDRNAKGAVVPVMTFTGMALGLQAALRIADGATAEQVAEEWAARISAAVDEIKVDTTGPGAPSFAGAVAAERQRQITKFGDQHHPDGTGLPVYQHSARRYRDHADRAAASGVLAWRDILLEEVHEALAEAEPDRLRTELVEVAAVCAAWIDDLDSREPGRA